MRKRLYLGVLLLLTLSCININAEVITLDGATELANTFFSQNVSQQKRLLKSATPQLEYAWDSNSLTQSGNTLLKSVEEDPTFYVFNNPDGEGFVIVSGDDNVRQVIGYSYESNAPAADEIPDPMKDYLLGIDSEIKWARENLTSTNKNLKATEAETRGNVVKYIETANYGQGSPYNKYCFTSTGDQAKTGCIPTAFSIIMYHYKWPNEGIGNLLNCQTGEAIEDRTYNWNNILSSYSGTSYTEEQANEIAKIMSHVGHAYMVTYGTGTTGGNTGGSTYYLSKYFDYKDITATLGNATDEATWINLVKESLQNNCPIPYESTNSGSGDSKHIFVLDGYTDNNYFHFNWGWNGYQNGYFVLSSMEPGDGDNYSGLANHKAFFNLKPNRPITIGVTIDPESAGTVTIAGESVTEKTVDFGTSVELVATGENFYGWLVGNQVVSTEKTYTVIANENITYTAQYINAENSVIIYHDYYEQANAEIEANCSISGLKESATSYPLGVELTVTANCGRGYKFNQWYTLDTNGESIIPLSTDNPFTFTTTPELISIFYSFSQISPIQPTVVSSNTDMGTVLYSITAGTAELYPGEKITLTATPKSGYMFTGWSVDGVTISTSKNYTVAVEEGKTYTANFALSGADYTVNNTTGTKTNVSGARCSTWTYNTTETNPVPLQLTSTAGSTEVYGLSNNYDRLFAYAYDVNTTGYNTITYTLSVPEGYIITGYEMTYWLGSSSYAEEEQVTVSNSTSTNTPTDTSDQTLYASGLTEQTTSFTVSASQTGQQYIGFSSFIVSVLSTGGGEVVPTQYTVTVSTNGIGGTATVNGEQTVTVNAGTSVSFSATPNEGYEFVNWTNGTSEVSGDNPFSAPINANITLTANFRETEQGGGEVEVAQLDRTNWTVTASTQEPAEAQWGGGGETRHAIDNSETTFWHSQWDASKPTVPHWIQFNLGGLYEISAINYVSLSSVTNQNNGQIKDYRLYISSSDISANINSTTYVPNGLEPVKDDVFTYGTTNHHNVTLDAPVIGQYIYLLVDDSYNVDASGVKFANCAEFYASGKPAYTVSATASPNNGGTASVSANVIGAGESVTFTATTNAGYNFLGWYNGEVRVSEKLEYTQAITADLTLTAKYEKQTFTVSATPDGENGTVTVSPNGTVEYGTEVTFTATANLGYRFVSWSNDETANPYITTITANTELTANFEALQSYTINVTTNGAGGTATASQGSVYENGTVTLTAEAADGYRFTGWYQNGELVTMANPYTIQSVTGNIDYEANFVESSDKLLLTFACLSDLHAQQDLITDANNIQLRESVTKTLNQIKTQENVDLIVLGGDYTSNNTIPETSWETTRELLINATRGAFNGTKTPVIYVNGNHEYEVANYDALPKNYNAGEYYGTPMKTDIGELAAADYFYETATNGTGESVDLLAAYHYVVNGFDFVVLNTGKNLFASASDYTYSLESVQWCESKLAEICATDKNKTVFFLIHIPFSDSNSLSSGKGMTSNDASALLKSTLAKYPNLIMLYGHDPL